MHPQYLTPYVDEITLLACRAGDGSAQHVALSYVQFDGLNELYKAMRGGADILDSSWECSAQNCEEFGDSILSIMSDICALYTYAENSSHCKSTAALFFIAPNLMGNCVMALDKIMESSKSVRWNSIAVSESEEIGKWLTDVANFFKNSQGVFRA